jgi:hypothetical protein
LKSGASNQQWQVMIKQEEENGKAVTQQRMKVK